jgi:AcrR family transcriptional regulator
MKPTRPELPEEFVAVHKQRRMIAAIAELSAEQGYEATKIADVVKRAGVARKTLYDNFDGKEDLFLSAFELYVREAREAVEAACEAGGSGWQSRIEAGLEGLMKFVADQHAAARMCLVEALSATSRSSQAYDEAVRGFVELLKANRPKAAALPETTEESLVGGVAWILHQRVRTGETQPIAGLASELTGFVLSPYLGVANSAR